MAQIHTSVTLRTSRDLTWSYGRWHCQRPATTRPTTFYTCKTRGCCCSFRLL